MEPELKKCAGCDTMVAWGTHQKSGKRAPMEPDANGQWLLRDGYWVLARAFEVPPTSPEQLYTPHHARCPKAEAFRRLARRKRSRS